MNRPAPAHRSHFERTKAFVSNQWFITAPVVLLTRPRISFETGWPAAEKACARSRKHTMEWASHQLFLLYKRIVTTVRLHVKRAKDTIERMTSRRGFLCAPFGAAALAQTAAPIY